MFDEQNPKNPTVVACVFVTFATSNSFSLVATIVCFVIDKYHGCLDKPQRIISGDLFEESWIELDAEVEKYENEYILESSAP